MTRILFVTFFPCIFLGLLSCENTYSKQDALKQSQTCLKIKNDLGRLSRERKPYFFRIAENIENETKVSDSTINSVRRISKEIQEKNSMYNEILQELKPKHKDSRFIDATLDFIQINQSLESKANLLVRSLLNPKSDKDIEKKLADDVEIAARRMTKFQGEYKILEFKFHNDNNINQEEVDSIVDIIKKNRT